ncbi:Engulfment and cell motility protein 1 [Aix galericulata]|nr:Engulfment and cell motility protein 1 [Aix galericulata]
MELRDRWDSSGRKATEEARVMQVVKEQIMRALTTKPSSLDQFKSKLQNLSYTEILKIRQSERMNQEDFQSRPILELKEKIQPEILELIKQQRLNRLVEGTCFRKLNSRRRQDKFWYCRLSPNHKVLHYGDLEESPQGEVPHDSLQDKLPVADIKAVVTGKDCPHMKEKGALKQNKEVLELAFSILYDSSGQLNFIAPDKHEYCVWTDGLNALLGKDMLSDLTRNDLDTLLSMEIKLRLLDLENIQIPDAPPPIPKEPSNYDFVYDYCRASVSDGYCSLSKETPFSSKRSIKELEIKRISHPEDLCVVLRRKTLQDLEDIWGEDIRKEFCCPTKQPTQSQDNRHRDLLGFKNQSLL